ncbi:reverse transcriptase domain-containing protein [Tanacetum coccineum]
MTPPPGLLTPPYILNNTTSERPPVITTVFSASTLENTSFAHRASTSANPNPIISPAFVEAKDYDEEREMEPRPKPNREATLTLLPRSLVVRRQQERVVGFEEAPNKEGSRGGRNAKGIRILEIEAREDGNRGVNLPPLPVAHLGRNGDFIGSVTPFVCWIEDYPLSNGLKMPSHIGSYDGKGDTDIFLHLFEGAIRIQKWLMHVACHMFTYTLKDSARIWWNSQKTGSILNYEDLKAKFRLHFSQQKKFTKTHLAVHNIKQREGESNKAFITRYIDDTLPISGLHEEHCISGFVYGLRTRSLVEHLSTYLPSTYKGLMEKTYTWIQAREVATNETPNDQRENFERSRKSYWDNKQGQKDRVRFSPYRGPNHGLLSNLFKSLREILTIEKLARSFEQPPHIFGNRRGSEIRAVGSLGKRSKEEREGVRHSVRTDNRHRKTTANKNQNKVIRPPEGVRRHLGMDYRTHKGSSENNNNRRKSFQQIAQSKRAETLGTSKAKKEKPGA